MAHEDRDLLPLGPHFDVVRRGYDRAQVEEHLDRLEADLRILAADRDAAVARSAELAKQVENQRVQLIASEREIGRMAALPANMDNMSERLQRMLRLAQDEATEIRARAEIESAELMARAEADGGALRDRYQILLAELEERRAGIDTERKSVLDKAQAQADKLVTEATELARRTEAESAARRQQIEEDFDIAMSSRRTQSMRALAEQEAKSKAEAERRVAAATEEANRRLRDATERSTRMVAEAKAEVDRLRELRDGISAQLRQVRSVLATATDALEPIEDERPGEERPGDQRPSEETGIAGQQTVAIPVPVAAQTTRPVVRGDSDEQPARTGPDEPTQAIRTGRSAPVAANRS